MQNESKGPFNSAGRAADFDPDKLVVRPITPDDWQAYRDYYKGLSDPHHFAGFLKDKDLNAKETYTNLFDNTINTGQLVMFGMFNGDKMIGQTSINYFDEGGKKTALLAGSEIADAYRGHRLVNRFYDARMKYLRDAGFDGEITTTIHPDNLSSQKAAARNGFVNTGQLDKHGYFIFRPGEKNTQVGASAPGPNPTPF